MTISTILATAEHLHLAVVEFVGVFDAVCSTAEAGVVVVPVVRGYT